MLERTVERITPARIDSYDDCNGNGMLTPFGTGTLNTYPLEYYFVLYENNNTTLM